MKTKTSIRFFNDIPIRAMWNNDEKKWLYSASDIINAITESNNSRRYWNTIKSRHIELSTVCRQLKLTASDGKQYLIHNFFLIDTNELLKLDSVEHSFDKNIYVEAKN